MGWCARNRVLPACAGLGDEPPVSPKSQPSSKPVVASAKGESKNGEADGALAGFLAEVTQMKQKLSAEAKPVKKTDWTAHLDSASGKLVCAALIPSNSTRHTKRILSHLQERLIIGTRRQM